MAKMNNQVLNLKILLISNQLIFKLKKLHNDTINKYNSNKNKQSSIK